jgi:hypothetical protein
MKARLLRELYMSIDRMNLYLVNGQSSAAQAERWHQRALRKDFESFGKKIKQINL